MNDKQVNPPKIAKESDLFPKPVQPTVGRIVHYRASDVDKPIAAIVTEINDDDTVGLTIFPPYVKTYTSVSYFVGAVKHGDEPGQWNWPPRE